MVVSERKLYNEVEPIIYVFYHAIYAIQNLFVLEWSCYGIMSVNVDI